jgi:hypothetical protein
MNEKQVSTLVKINKFLPHHEIHFQGIRYG